MKRYMVRPRLSEQESLGGRQGGQGIVVRAETAEQAKNQGAADLGVAPSSLEAVEFDDGGNTLIANMPPEVIEAALKNRGDQDTGIADPNPRRAV